MLTVAQVLTVGIYLGWFVCVVCIWLVLRREPWEGDS
jgi:hypothetical protein